MTIKNDISLMEKMNQAVSTLLSQHKVWKEDQEAIVKRIQEIQCLKDTAHHEHDEFPYISSAVLFTGCACLLRLMILEYRNYSSKAASIGGRKGDVSINEFLQYRLDYYFSSSQWAKPILLLGLSFVIILQASIVSIIFNGDDLSGAMWKAWTHVADPGEIPQILLLDNNICKRYLVQ
jgi:hypothetical protein